MALMLSAATPPIHSMRRGVGTGKPDGPKFTACVEVWEQENPTALNGCQ
jgi:hypothetical protein